MICVEKYTHEYIVSLKKALTNSSAILEHMSMLSEIIKMLRTLIKGLDKIIDPIWTQVETEKISYERAKKLLLRTIPLINIYGYEHFLYSILKSDNTSEAFVEKIYPNFIQEYSQLLFKHSFF